MFLRKFVFINIFIVLAACLVAQENDYKINSENQEEQKDEDANEKIVWYSFAEAVKMNQGFPKKKILVDMFTDWCGWCKKMDAVTFSHPEIIKYINDHYWAVKFNAEGFDTVNFNGVTYINPNPQGTKRSTHQLTVTLLSRQLTYPSYVFFNENNQILTVVKGYIKPKSFEPVIHYFGDNSHFKMSWEEFNKTFHGNIKE
jgi:thioredoxin-related protein